MQTTLQNASMQTSLVSQEGIDTTFDAPAKVLEYTMINADPQVAQLVNGPMQMLVQNVSEVPSAAVCLTQWDSTKVAIRLRVCLLCPALPGKRDGFLRSTDTCWGLSSRPGLGLFKRWAV